ncbi:MAG: hypothetical protein R2827_13165 [Bdellovibrionales bacterium]
MIYGQFAYTIAKRYLTRNFRPGKPNSCSHNLSDTNKQVILRNAPQLAMISYHIGPGNMIAEICKFAQAKSGNLTDADFRFKSGDPLGAFFTSMKDEKGRDKEGTRYARKIHTELWGIENNREVYKNNQSISRSAAEPLENSTPD